MRRTNTKVTPLATQAQTKLKRMNATKGVIYISEEDELLAVYVY